MNTKMDVRPHAPFVSISSSDKNSAPNPTKEGVLVLSIENPMMVQSRITCLEHMEKSQLDGCIRWSNSLKLTKH